jgi:hypothetical protein
VDNTNAGNFGTNPTPLWESVCPTTDAQNYKAKQRMRLGITNTIQLVSEIIKSIMATATTTTISKIENPTLETTTPEKKQTIARKTNPASSNESTQKNLLDSKTYLNGTDLTTTRKPKFAADSAKEKVKAVALDLDASTFHLTNKAAANLEEPKWKALDTMIETSPNIEYVNEWKPANRASTITKILGQPNQNTNGDTTPMTQTQPGNQKPIGQNKIHNIVTLTNKNFISTDTRTPLRNNIRNNLASTPQKSPAHKTIKAFHPVQITNNT